MTAIGIMQGRLLPQSGDRIQEFPRNGWEREFELAAAAGLVSIEWIYDAAGEDANPIENDVGIARMTQLAKQHGVGIRSLCADWLMEHPLVHADEPGRREWLERLRWMVGRCRTLGVRRVVLPFVDNAAIESEADAELAADALREAAEWARRRSMELHVESSLPPARLRALIESVAAPEVRVNYDSGNSAALGYDPAEELAAYGDLIGSVHVKDRVRDGGTVALGDGDADISAVFAGLHAQAYAGDLILQTARGRPGDELSWAGANRLLVQQLWESAS